VILGARVASAAGDAGLRARVLQATDLLERERPAIPLFTGVAGYARGILERDARALLAAANVLQSSSRPFLYAGAAEDAGAELARTDRGDEALDQLNAAFDSYMQHEALADARRVGRELRRLGVECRIVSQPRAKTGWDSLTDSELKVVNLIAQGATNRSVAQRLVGQDYMHELGFDESHPLWVVRRNVIDVIGSIEFQDMLRLRLWCSGTSTRWCQMRVRIDGRNGGLIESEAFWINTTVTP
jgi:hypothetical protein